MKKLNITNKLGQRFQKVSYKIQKHSPEILIFAGVGGVIVSTVMACKATPKLDDILTESRVKLDDIRKAASDEAMADRYSQKDAQKDMVITYIQTSVKVAKNYAPAAVIGVLSISSIFASNNILKQRNVALAAAYTALDTSFKEYRTRVFERFGEEVENEIRYNMKSQKIEVVETDENGKEKKVKKTVSVANLGNSDYARYFDKECKEYERDHSYNEMILKARQAWANDKLKANGYLYLNDVYDFLGIPRTKAGQVVGWIYDPNNTRGDNYVDFGMKEVYRKDETKEYESVEKLFLLDFNVDGNIWELMK